MNPISLIINDNIECPLQSKSFESIRDYLERIFIESGTENFQLVDLEYLEVAKKISNDNLNNTSTPTRTYVYILSKVEKDLVRVGKIDFLFRTGMSTYAKEETRNLGPQDYFAYLSYIEIFPNFQGKGLASAALRTWHACMDKLVPLTILGVASETSYAAMTYKKAGYEFTAVTRNDISNWYRKLPEKERLIKQEKGQNEILRDQNEFFANSARLLNGEWDHAFMIRWNSIKIAKRW